MGLGSSAATGAAGVTVSAGVDGGRFSICSLLRIIASPDFFAHPVPEKSTDSAMTAEARSFTTSPLFRQQSPEREELRKMNSHSSLPPPPPREAYRQRPGQFFRAPPIELDRFE